MIGLVVTTLTYYPMGMNDTPYWHTLRKAGYLLEWNGIHTWEDLCHNYACAHVRTLMSAITEHHKCGHIAYVVNTSN